ncbi:MAG: hypothetical protein ABIJ97_15915 [Bacteroidota bacterium]
MALGLTFYNQFILMPALENANDMIWAPLHHQTKVYGQTDEEKQWNRAVDDLFSHAVSKVRQPMEGFFNWLIEKQIFRRLAKSGQRKVYWYMFLGKLQQPLLTYFLTFDSHFYL